jgi:hypothetical protein
MSIEVEVAALTSATTALTNAVAVQQTNVNNSVNNFNSAVEVFTEVSSKLSNVDNTSDEDKEISTPVAEALAEKQDKLVSGENVSTINGQDILGGEPLVIARGRVEIPVLKYEDRNDLRFPVVPIPLLGDIVQIPHLGELQFIDTLEYIDDDEMAFEAVSPADGVTPIGQWYLSNPAYEWLEAQQLFEHAVIYEWIEDERERLNIN